MLILREVLPYLESAPLVHPLMDKPLYLQERVEHFQVEMVTHLSMDPQDQEIMS